MDLPPIEITATHSTYESERVASEWAGQIRVGKDFYLVGTYEAPRFTLVGQGFKMKTIGLGAGYRRCKDNLCGFGELLYHKPEVSVEPDVRDEAVWTKLKNDHGTPEWIPEHNTYKLDPGYGGRFGISYEYRSALLSLSYRFLSFNERIDSCTGIDPSCHFPVTGNHWQNLNTMKMNSMELGIGVKF